MVMAGGGVAGTTPDVLALPAPQSTEPENEFDVVLRHRRLRVNSVEILQNCQILQGGKVQMDVPLCRMISLQVVRLALAMDIEKMKADFIHGYRPEAAVFYVSTTNIQGTERTVSDEDRRSWNAHWRRKNLEFEEFLSADPELHFPSNKMFYVYDGNHRLVAGQNLFTRHIRMTLTGTFGFEQLFLGLSTTSPTFLLRCTTSTERLRIPT